MKKSGWLLLGGAAAVAVLAHRAQSKAVASAAPGVSGLGDVSKVKYGDNAFIAPEFRDGIPGTYSIDVRVTAVPITADKRLYFDLAQWNDSIARNGYKGITVTAVRYVVSDTNPRSTGSALDVFGVGTEVADYTYRLTVVVSDKGGPNDQPGAGTAGLSGVPAAWAVAGIVVAVSLLIYWITGENIIVDAIRFVGKALAAGGAAVVEGLTPILLLAGVALVAFTMMGGRASYKGITVGRSSG